MDLKVQPGDPITASFMNRVIDRLPSDQSGFSAGGLSMHRSIIQVINNSAANRDTGELLDVGLATGSTESIFDAVESVELAGTTPVAGRENFIAVCAEPIPNGERGNVVVSGICFVKLASGISSNDQFVKVDQTTTTKAASATAGFGKVFGSLTLDNSDLYALCLIGGVTTDTKNLFQTPAGGIPARSGTTAGSAACTPYYINPSTGAIAELLDSNGNSQTLTVFNVSASAVAGNAYIQAKLAGSTLVADMEDCG